MAVCKCSRDKAAVMLHNAQTNKDHAELAKSVLHEDSKYKFPGRGQRAVYVFNIEEAIIFLDCLPHRHTGDIKQYIRNQFLRLTGGDLSLVPEIVQNAQSNGFVQQAAREVLNLPVAASVVMPAAVAVIDHEADEDRAMKKRKFEIEMARMELENQTIDIQNQKMQAEVNNFKIESAKKNKITLEELFGGPQNMDDRDRMMLNDSVRNMAFPNASQTTLSITNGQAAITNVPSAQIEQFTTDDLIREAGFRPTKELLLSVGRALAAKYRVTYPGKEPMTCKRYVDGAQRDVKFYLLTDKPWLLEEAERVCVASKNNPEPGQSTLARFVTRA